MQGEGRSTARARRRGARDVAAAGALALLCGCNVGPRYDPPGMPAPPGFKEGAPGAFTRAPPGTWQPARPGDAVLKGKWWEIFREPELDALESQLDINNQTVAQYFQNFMAARAQIDEARTGYFPTVSAAPSYNVTGLGSASSGSFGGGPTGTTTTVGPTGSGATGVGTTGLAIGTQSYHVTSFFSLPLDVSWEPDLWGRIRNTVREYEYAAQVSAADLENERLTEQADLAAYYFELRGQDALQEVYGRTIEADRHALELTRWLVVTGIDSQQAVAQAEVTLYDAEEAGIGVARNRAIYEHAIATLVGKPASEFSLPVKVLSTPVPAIPIGVPSELLQRRPDIAAAERTMAQANAAIGIAKAAYYPTVSLTGSGGLQSTSLANLFSVPALVWSLGASATETIFDGGLRRATVAQYEATYKADVAAYKQTVLTAFQQVEDELATLRVVSQQIERQEAGVRSAGRYLEIAMALYQTGVDPYLDVITAQTTLLTNEQTEVTLRVTELAAAVQLVQALGGGWSVAELPAASKIRSKEAAFQIQTTD